MEKILAEYIQYQSNRWSKATLKSETSRLKACLPLLGLSAGDLYDTLAPHKKPYSIKTLFIRLGNFIDWCRKQGYHQGPNKYKEYLISHSLRFKHAYQTERLTVTFEQAEERIKTISNQKIQEHCLAMLYTGVRISESITAKDGFVTGKGNKPRKIFEGKYKLQAGLTKWEIYSSLKTVGLKPHSLRKLFATKLADRTKKPADLCKVLGWESYKTAEKYIQPKQDSELADMIAGIGK